MNLITTHIVGKFDIGINDNMFGGKLMSIIDICGAAIASETAKSQKVVTKKISEVMV